VVAGGNDVTIPKQDINAAIELLCDRFPWAFFQFERKRVPLKIGIRDDIVAILGDALDRNLPGLALRFYTSNFGYRSAQKEGVARIDLDGNACGVVSEADALSAANDVASRKAALKARNPLKPPVTTSPAPTPETTAPPPPLPYQKDGLATLREAAQRRREAAATVKAALVRPVPAGDQLPVRANPMNREKRPAINP
jgi:ProP effector